MYGLPYDVFTIEYDATTVAKPGSLDFDFTRVPK